MRYRSRGGLSRLMRLPTALATLELLLLPAALWLCRSRSPWAALPVVMAALLDLSAWALICRFGMGTRVGCALAPIARALSRAGLLLCLCARARRLLLPAALALLRPLRPESSAPLYALEGLPLLALILAHLLVPELPAAASAALTALASACLLVPLLRRKNPCPH